MKVFDSQLSQVASAEYRHLSLSRSLTLSLSRSSGGSKCAPTTLAAKGMYPEKQTEYGLGSHSNSEP